MNTYELMILYFPNLKGETLKSEQKKLKDKVKELGGSVVSEDNMGLKSLAYEMNKQIQANYFLVVFTLDPLETANLNLWLKREESTVLRFLVTKVNKKDTETKKKK